MPGGFEGERGQKCQLWIWQPSSRPMCECGKLVFRKKISTYVVSYSVVVCFVKPEQNRFQSFIYPQTTGGGVIKSLLRGPKILRAIMFKAEVILECKNSPGRRKN